MLFYLAHNFIALKRDYFLWENIQENIMILNLNVIESSINHTNDDSIPLNNPFNIWYRHLSGSDFLGYMEQRIQVIQIPLICFIPVFISIWRINIPTSTQLYRLYSSVCVWFLVICPKRGDNPNGWKDKVSNCRSFNSLSFWYKLSYDSTIKCTIWKGRCKSYSVS